MLTEGVLSPKQNCPFVDSQSPHAVGTCSLRKPTSTGARSLMVIMFKKDLDETSQQEALRVRGDVGWRLAWVFKGSSSHDVRVYVCSHYSVEVALGHFGRYQESNPSGFPERDVSPGFALRNPCVSIR